MKLKLITTAESPFGARVLIAARAKGVAVECVPLPGGTVRSSAFRALNPISKIPVLITESGTVIPESEAILNYVEDCVPTPSLRPQDPEERARIAVAIRIMDTYVMAPVIRLFPHLDPSKRDERTVEQEVSRWQDGMTALAHFMQSPLPGTAAGVSLADCVLPPSLHLGTRIARMLGLKDDPLESHEALRNYYSRMAAHPIVGEVLRDLTTAQKMYDSKAKGDHPKANTG